VNAREGVGEVGYRQADGGVHHQSVAETDVGASDFFRTVYLSCWPHGEGVLSIINDCFNMLCAIIQEDTTAALCHQGSSPIASNVRVTGQV
jgi:hypothetical protein